MAWGGYPGVRSLLVKCLLIHAAIILDFGYLTSSPCIQLMAPFLQFPKTKTDDTSRLIEVDDFIAKLWEVHLAVKKEGYVQVSLRPASPH